MLFDKRSDLRDLLVAPRDGELAGASLIGLIPLPHQLPFGRCARGLIVDADGLTSSRVAAAPSVSALMRVTDPF